MDDGTRVSGARRARLHSRRHRRRQRYGRFLGLTILGTLVPGAGLLAAGKRRLGGVLMFLLALGGVVAAAILVLVPQGKLASYAGDRQMLFIVGAALAVAAAVWLAVALGTHRSLEPAGLSPGKRLGGALVVVLAASMVVAPMAVGSMYAFTQRNLIGAISAGGASHTTPDIDERDPWENKPRLNVLFLGSDAGEGRQGVRPDSQIVASIDTKTGDTTMISLPRNLQNFEFPEDSPLSALYPNGFNGEGDPGEWMLNAVYRNVPTAHPEVFEGVADPGADANKWAVEGALGLDIDYYLMVNLQGFQKVVDALGGITIDVPRDIPWGNKSLPDGTCTRANGYIHAGEDQHLNGFQALWFARSRCGADDYDRMERQRCVMNAIVAKADPTTLLSKYRQLATTASDIITTDVPEKLFPALIELMLKVQGASLKSLTLDDDFFASMGTTSADPDYDQLHARITEILEGGGATEAEGSTSSGGTTEAAEQASSEETNAQGGGRQATDTTDDTGERSSTETSPPPSADPEAEPDEPVDAAAVC